MPPAAEALERLGMPMEEAMRTQRAVRRLRPEPVSHDVLLPLLELSLKAPTSSNTQDWSYLVVENRDQKARLARLYRRLYRVFNPIVERMAAGDDKALRQMRPGQWQAEHFEDIPVFVIPCYRRGLKHRPVGRPQIAVSSFYGSVYPAVQNLLLACRALRLGGIDTDPADLVRAGGEEDPGAAASRQPGLHHSDRLGEGPVRSDHPTPDR